MIFDECLSLPAIRALIQPLALSARGAEMAHVLERFGVGARDEVWIPALAADGDWIVVSGDRGKKSPAHRKLPVLCEQFRLTHVVVSRGLNRRTMDYKIQVIQKHWIDILATAEAPKGSGFSLHLLGDSGTALSLKTSPPAEDSRSGQLP